MIQIRTHVSTSGEIRLEVSRELADRDVIVTIETAGESKGWPEGFFERFPGCLPEFSDIEAEGQYEKREQL